MRLPPASAPSARAPRTRLVAWALLACVACGAPARPLEEAPPSAPAGEVRVAEDATAAALLRAVRGALIARGHEGECFLAWDVEASDALTVHVGARARSAAISCGGLDGVATALEGRCPFVRFFWVEGEDLRTEALTFYFAPAGRAYAARPVAGAGVGAPARELVFREAPEGTRLVLGVELPSRAPQKQAEEPTSEAPAAGDDPLQDPEILEAVTQLVRRVQRCNPSGRGSLVLEWQVEPDGRIAAVQPVTSTVAEAALECALEVLSEVSFPEHGAERPVDYCVPVLLDPSLRPRDQAARGE